MCKKRKFHCAEVRCFSACANVQKIMIFYCDKRRCFCTCAKREYFIAPRGDVLAHAKREDISLHQEEIFQRMLKERIFHCAKRRCFRACAKRWYFIAPRGDASLKHKVIIFHCTKRRCFSACAKRGYFIAPRGDVPEHAQRENISLRQDEKYLVMRKDRIAPRYVSVHAQREEVSTQPDNDGAIISSPRGKNN
jgi:hypothetical protein